MSISLLSQAAGFAQAGPSLDISARFGHSLQRSAPQDKFRPQHLRSLSYDANRNAFRLILDKGDAPEDLRTGSTETTKTLLTYFITGVSLPQDLFWVNLRPDSPNDVIDPALAATDMGRVLLEADVQLKKDAARLTSPQTPEGKEYWDKLYKKSAELFGYAASSVPTLTRPWIVPGEIILRESGDQAYVYKASLKVMLEQDYLKSSEKYSFPDPRSRELNEYSSQLIRELVIPQLEKEVNTSRSYAGLRQVYYSLVLAHWFKQRYRGRSGTYPSLIDSGSLNGITSQRPWSQEAYFKQYQDSFNHGEYNIEAPVRTPAGQVIRRYFSGGIRLMPKAQVPAPGSAAVDPSTGAALVNVPGDPRSTVSGSNLQEDEAMGGTPQDLSPAMPERRRARVMALGSVGVRAGQVTIRKGGESWEFERKYFPAYDHRKGFFLSRDGEKMDLMAYGLEMEGDGAQQGLNGMWINDDLREKGLLRPLLNLYFSGHPRTARTYPDSPLFAVQDILAGEYGFGPGQGVAPTVWFRHLPDGPHFAAQRGKGIRYQVFFEPGGKVWDDGRFQEYERKFRGWEGSTQYEILRKEDVPEGEKDSFRGLYFGSSLSVVDDAQFQQALARFPVVSTTYRVEVPWYDRPVEVFLPKEEMKRNYQKLADISKELSAALAEEGIDLGNTDFSDMDINAYMGSLRHAERLFREGGWDAQSFETELFEFHSEMSPGASQYLGKGYYDRQAGEAVHALIQDIFSEKGRAAAAKDPVRYAAEVFAGIIKAQAFHNGNHRVADLVLNFILVKNGQGYFFLTPGNVLGYYRLFNLSDIESGKCDLDKAAAYFRSQASASMQSRARVPARPLDLALLPAESVKSSGASGSVVDIQGIRASGQLSDQELSYALAGVGDGVFRDEGKPEFWKDALRPGEYAIATALVNGKGEIDGFLLAQEGEGYSYLRLLGARHPGNGAGTMLMDDYFKRLQEQRVRRAEWWAMGNSPAFYDQYLNGRYAFENKKGYYRVFFATPTAGGKQAAGAGDKGGIDLRSLPLPYAPAPGGFGNRVAHTPVPASLEMEKETEDLRSLAVAGILPSGDRVGDLLAQWRQAAGREGGIPDIVLGCVAQVMRLEEEQCVPADPRLRELLLTLETGGTR